jgi:hypothetical protein
MNKPKYLPSYNTYVEMKNMYKILVGKPEWKETNLEN